MKDSYLKRYPLSHLVAAAVVVLSLAPMHRLPPLPDVGLLDKWAHLVMYGALSLTVWWEHTRRRPAPSWPAAAVGAMLLPALLGGALELAQAWLTTCRSGEWLDFVADCLGVLLGTLLAYGAWHMANRAKRKR